MLDLSNYIKLNGVVVILSKNKSAYLHCPWMQIILLIVFKFVNTLRSWHLIFENIFVWQTSCLWRSFNLSNKKVLFSFSFDFNGNKVSETTTVLKSIKGNRCNVNVFFGKANVIVPQYPSSAHYVELLKRLWLFATKSVTPGEKFMPSLLPQ